ncbi:MAG: cytidyltransferase [Lachnospiraceae bacterium]|nr:cytidyltransferase [Lachnospiraceae bacterium]
MRILAVIPARSGSRGIPNKNIRIICGHPLIYYSIRNALTSKFVTDVIVTTDSEAVKIIATQMGADCKWRDESLCGDDVTLDAVVYDAIPKLKKWDYIITMQPTSPTLQAETLDRAIQHTIDKGFDTLISAINAPHLSWGEKDGDIVPNYEKRLNRQYLPPCYMETGAFIISRTEVVTADTRIGKRVGIYKISEEEAIDIDTFSDLKIADELLNKRKIGIYVNGNNKRGIGHIYRALEMADEFYTKPDIYYDINQTNPAVFGRTTHNLIGLNGIAELFDRCKEEQYTIFINDILATSIDYMIGLRSVLPKAKIVNFEDDGEGAIKADLVINALYRENELRQVYSGEKYFISGKTFMFYNPILIKEKVKNIFISFGGSDPQNYSDRILNMISKDKYSNYNFTVVLGRAKSNVSELIKYNEYKNINVLYDVDNMPDIMTKCDVGITSRGRTGYELAMLGIPSIAMAQNKREEKHGFVCNENGFSYIGLNPADEIIEGNLNIYLSMSQATRQGLQDRLLSHNLRNGRKRVMALINNL